MNVSSPYSFIGIAAILGAIVVAGFATFHFTREGAEEEPPRETTAPTATPSDSLFDPFLDEDADLTARIVTLLPKDAIRAILDPEFASAQAAEDENMVFDGRAVLGVAINGDARAYPINVLSAHEIVNDVVGGESIAVTW